MRHQPTGEYPPEWPAIALAVKQAAGWKCERCGRPHIPGRPGYVLTVHHLDGDKSNCEPWNLAALCQACHLHVQGRVFLPQFFMFEHSEWFKPHVQGYYRAHPCGAIIPSATTVTARDILVLDAVLQAAQQRREARNAQPAPGNPTLTRLGAAALLCSPGPGPGGGGPGSNGPGLAAPPDQPAAGGEA